jgi:hypothetical protein
VNKTCLVGFESRAAPSCLLFSVRDNRILNGLRVLYSVVSDNLYVKVVDEPKPLNSQPTLQELVDKVDEIGHQPTRLVDYKSSTRLNYLTNQSVIS